MKLAAGLWIAVIDGAKAIVMVNEGSALEPRLKVLRTMTHDNPPTRLQGRDRPGRVVDSGGPNKSSVEMPDLHRRAEDAFVADVMDALERHADKGAFKQIVLVAPPVAMGTVRKEMGSALKPCVVGEITADYVKMPVPEIGKAVARALEL